MALHKAARKFAKQGNIEFARTALMTAEANVPEIEIEFLRDFAWSCLAETYDSIGDTAIAQNCLNHIDGADLKAWSFWHMWAARYTKGESSDVEELKSQAIEATKAADTFKRVAMWSEASETVYRIWEKGLAEDYLGNAIAVVSGMQTRWLRGRALSRIANSVIALQSASGGRRAIVPLSNDGSHRLGTLISH
tara:strand:+ start:3090 stop:3668 length:579 start_codon:yes stop_codon:yes gene_type:complete